MAARGGLSARIRAVQVQTPQLLTVHLFEPGVELREDRLHLGGRLGL
jgi:hypothetical protein